MMNDKERAEFDAECKAICERAKEYERKGSGEKLRDVRRALGSVAIICADRSAKVARTDDDQARIVGSVSTSVSYLADILQGVLENTPVAPVAIEELQRLLKLLESPIPNPAK